MNNKELLSAVFAGDPKAIKTLQGRLTTIPRSGAVVSVPMDGTLPDNVVVYQLGVATTLGKLKARNERASLWALFTPVYKEVPYAVFDGVKRLDREEWPEMDYWTGALAPIVLKRNAPFNFAMTGGNPIPHEPRLNWMLPGFRWASK